MDSELIIIFELTPFKSALTCWIWKKLTRVTVETVYFPWQGQDPGLLGHRPQIPDRSIDHCKPTDLCSKFQLSIKGSRFRRFLESSFQGLQFFDKLTWKSAKQPNIVHGPSVCGPRSASTNFLSAQITYQRVQLVIYRANLGKKNDFPLLFWRLKIAILAHNSSSDSRP
jgi:hypothetical protein